MGKVTIFLLSCMLLGSYAQTTERECDKLKSSLDSFGSCPTFSFLGKPCKNLCTGETVNTESKCNVTPECCWVYGECQLRQITGLGGMSIEDWIEVKTREMDDTYIKVKSIGDTIAKWWNSL